MKPKISVLDAFLMNPGDFSWNELLRLGDCKIYERTPKHLVLERCKDAEIVITNKVLFSKEQFEQLPKLKYIGETATGYDNIDIQAAAKKGVIVTHVPAYSTFSVAQHTFALLLELSNQVGFHNSAVHSGEWERAPDFSFWKTPLIELYQKTLGVIGYGAIGKSVAKIALGFDMKILINGRLQKDPNVEYVDLKTLLEKSDIVTLHCPLTKETQHLINEETIAFMKPNSILINTARGGLIDEKALAKALKEKKIFAAALDVLDREPPPPECPLLHLENCTITPHIAWASKSARQRLFSTVLDNVKAYLAGAPKNVVLPRA